MRIKQTSAARPRIGAGGFTRCTGASGLRHQRIRVVMWGGVRAWGVTRYAEARALLNDPGLSKDQAHGLALFPPGTDGSHASSLNVNMLLKDPPDHARLRQFASKACAARPIGEQLRAGIEQIADELLDGIGSSAVEGAAKLDGALPSRPCRSE